MLSKHRGLERAAEQLTERRDLANVTRAAGLARLTMDVFAGASGWATQLAAQPWASPSTISGAIVFRACLQLPSFPTGRCACPEPRPNCLPVLQCAYNQRFQSTFVMPCPCRLLHAFHVVRPSLVRQQRRARPSPFRVAGCTSFCKPACRQMCRAIEAVTSQNVFLFLQVGCKPNECRCSRESTSHDRQYWCA